ncbi:MAG: SUMF1/EgtB/PvdO family nonheme iron enzyme [Candidatus Competibacter sp.]
MRLGNGAKPDAEADDNENWPADAAPLEIADFELAAYPVTVAQFKPFVEQGGYREERYWSADGWRWREEENQSEPWLWNDPVWTVPNQPVIGVSWYEAEAYCRWLDGAVAASTRNLPLADGSRMGMGGARAGGAALSVGRRMGSLALQQLRIRPRPHQRGRLFSGRGGGLVAGYDGRR